MQSPDALLEFRYRVPNAACDIIFNQNHEPHCSPNGSFGDLHALVFMILIAQSICSKSRRIESQSLVDDLLHELQLSDRFIADLAILKEIYQMNINYNDEENSGKEGLRVLEGLRRSPRITCLGTQDAWQDYTQSMSNCLR